MSARGPAIIRNLNRFDVLHTIRLHDNQISRSELAEVTGLSQATISSIVSHLIAEGALVEEGSLAPAIRGRGRPLVSLRLAPEYMYVAGVKIATHQIVVSITDFTGHILTSENISCEPLELTASQLAAFVAKAVRGCVKKANIDPSQVSGVGVGVPGFVDCASGTVYWSPVFQTRNIEFAKLLSPKFEAPIFVENDANLVTLAEHWFGLAKGLKHVIVITIEHGTGSGLIINGSLFRGARGIGAEFGHTKLVFDGPLCQCGQSGCMETHTAGFAILREAQALGFPIPSKKLDYHARLDLLRKVVERAENGDQGYREIFRKMGLYLGLGIANLVNLINPERVVVCEGAVTCSHLYGDAMRSTIREMVIAPLKDNFDLLIHHWGDEVWARGAASLVLQELDQRGSLPIGFPARKAAKRRRRPRAAA
jgi:transcriptional regulator of PTS gene